MRHHYVPRFYLQLFVDPNVPLIETDYVWECHLRTGGIKRRAPTNVATKTDYYKIPGVPDELAQTVEASFSQMESVTAPILRRFEKGDLTLEGQQRADFLFFLAFLAVRVPGFRNRIEGMYEEMAKEMATMSASHREHFVETMKRALAHAGKPIPSDDEIEKQRQWTLNPDNYTIEANPVLSIMHGHQLALELIYPIFDGMRWSFYKAPDGVEFITTDCPVSWYDPTPRPAFYSGHGLGMRGVEVTFPINPRTTLLGTHEGPGGVHDASVDQVLLFNLRKLYWTEEHAYAASESAARQARALVMFNAMAEARQDFAKEPNPTS